MGDDYRFAGREADAASFCSTRPSPRRPKKIETSSSRSRRSWPSRVAARPPCCASPIKVGSFTAHSQSTALSVLAPLKLDFKQSNFSATSLVSSLGDAGPSLTGSSSFVFVPDPSAAPSDTVAGKIRLALNYDSDGCNDRLIDRCVYDTSFAPIPEQQRTTRDATGAPVVTYAVDFDAVDRIAALSDGAFGEQSTDDSLLAMVTRLPVIGGYTYDNGARIAGNTTPVMAVPEPAAWGMMIVGFGLVGTMARRRRRMVAA